MLDFGGGDGTLSVEFMSAYPLANVACYEPSSAMRDQAAAVLPNLRLYEAAADIPPGAFDLVTCCEVFEHLPEPETAAALDAIAAALRPGGLLVVGVPNEIFLMGLLKGCFRMARRHGEYDATWSTVMPSALGRPPRDRPVTMLDDLPFIYPHTGFDFRTFAAVAASHSFMLRSVSGSPFPRAPACCNAEIYFLFRLV